MKVKQLIVLGVIFFALAGVNLIQKIQDSKSTTGEVRHEEWHPLIPQENVARVLFSRPGHPALTLVKDAGEWKVEELSGVSADKQKVQALLTQLGQFKAELRAEGQDLYARFGVTDQDAFRIQVLDAKNSAIVDFFMGSRRAGNGVFIRLPGQAKIYFVPDDLPALFGLYADLDQAGPQPVFFADLRLVPESFEQIQRFEIAEFRNGKKETRAVLERPSLEAGTPWHFLSKVWKFSVGHEKVEDYLARVFGAHAENITVDAPAFKNEMEIMLRDERGKVLRLQFSKASGGWLVRREGSAPVYEISETVFQDLKSEDVAFAEENPFGLKLGDGSTVELIHDGRKETFSPQSGESSAIAIMDAAMKIRFLATVPEIHAQDLSVLPPTHQLKITSPGKPAFEIKFYVPDPKAEQIKTVISGYDPVFIVNRAFFESIFIPEKAPPAEEKQGD